MEQHTGLNIAPGKRACDIQTKPVGMTRRAEVNCNVQCYSHPECVAFVMGFDGRGHPKCYMKRCTKPLVVSPGTANTSVLTWSTATWKEMGYCI